MTPIFGAALELQRFCQARDWRSCIIGGIALLRWGQPRFTRDVDLTLLTGFGQEHLFIDALLSAYRPRISDAGEFARRHRVLLLTSELGVPLDIAFAGLPYEVLAVERSSPFDFEPGCSLVTCSAEDLLVQKLFAFRPKDLLDAQSVADRMRGQLDWTYVHTHLAPLAEVKEMPEIMLELGRLTKAVI